MKKVRDFMNKRVIYFSPKNTLLEITKSFAEYHISGAPIVENGKLVGVISKSDIVRFVNEKLYKRGTEVNSTTSSLILNIAKSLGMDGKKKKDIDKVLDTNVGAIMIHDVIYVTPDTDTSKVVELMVDKGINRIPVLEGGKLVGIVARDDLIRSFKQ